MHGLIGEEYTHRQQHGRTEPHTCGHGYLPVTGHLIARIVYDIVENKQQNRDNQRHTEATLADNGTERCADKEEYHASERKSEFLLQFNIVTADQFPFILDHKPTELMFLTLGIGLIESGAEIVDLHSGTRAAEQRIDIHRLCQRHIRDRLLNLHRIVAHSLAIRQSEITRLGHELAIAFAYAVNSRCHRINRHTKLRYVFTHILAAHSFLIHSVEFGIERHQNILS